MTARWTLTLSWPAPPLWANWRGHWSKHAEAVAKAKHEAWVLAKEAGIRTPHPTATLRFTFHPSPRSRPDVQNLPHTVKAHTDGIALAMGCDDRDFRPLFPSTLGERRRPGAVVVEIFTEDGSE